MKLSQLNEICAAFGQLGFTDDTNIEVVIGGTQIYEIDGAGTKWAPVEGTRKYNKDAFIVIRKPQEVVSSQPLEEFTPAHALDTHLTQG
jgi:hypothetical protein